LRLFVDVQLADCWERLIGLDGSWWRVVDLCRGSLIGLKVKCRGREGNGRVKWLGLGLED
jgi:hypothetical protein